MALTLFALRLAAGARPRRRPGAVPGVRALPAGALVPAAGGAAVTCRDLPDAQRRPEHGLAPCCSWPAGGSSATADATPTGARCWPRSRPRPSSSSRTSPTTSRWARSASPARAPIRAVYFAILVSHTVLAAAIVPLVLVTLARALRGRFEAHRALARIHAAAVAVGVRVRRRRLLDAVPALGRRSRYFPRTAWLWRKPRCGVAALVADRLGELRPRCPGRSASGRSVASRSMSDFGFGRDPASVRAEVAARSRNAAMARRFIMPSRLPERASTT